MEILLDDVFANARRDREVPKHPFRARIVLLVGRGAATSRGRE